MKTIFLDDLFKNNPQLWHEALRTGKVIGVAVEVPDDFPLESSVVEAPTDPFQQVVSRIQPPIIAMPRADWPVWAKALALLAKKSDTGLGDVIERIVGPIGGDAYKAWHLKTYGTACGCSERKEDLNSKYPLDARG